MAMDKQYIRIITIDSCMCAPISGLDTLYSEFRGSSVNLVPIIRVYGSTATGEKICVHIHRVFPYLYIPYDGAQDANSLMYQIAANIDKAVNISLNQASSSNQHVYKISLVSGIPMYGYHTKRHQYFKIFLYNPLLIKKVSNLLLNDTTLGRIYQPHECHLNFTLQFMIDHNLHGMNNMILSELKYRYNPDVVNSNVDAASYLPPSITKVTVCELEGDAFAEHILNRQEIASGNIAVNPGLTALWADEQQRRRNKGETSQIGNFIELKRNNLPPTKTHLFFKQALIDKLSDSSVRAETDKLSESVYPAETPDEADVQNASLAEFHTLSSSLDFTLDDSTLLSPNDLNETSLSSSQPKLNDVSLNAEAMDLLEILNELGENTNESLEDDSILSQTAKPEVDEKDVEDEVEDFDLSMPLEPVTPTKMNVQTFNDSYNNSGSDDDLDKTLVPQLDGAYSDSDVDHPENFNHRTKKCNSIKLESYDGQKDFSSSSSDEENTNLKSIKTQKSSSRYTPLPILIKSPKTSSSKSMANKEKLLLNTTEKDEQVVDRTSRSQKFVEEFEVKRKLDFSSCLEFTKVEEQLECAYARSAPNKTIRKLNHTANTMAPVDEKSGAANECQEDPKKFSMEDEMECPDYISEDEQISCSPLFEEENAFNHQDNNLNRSFFLENLTAAEKYDRENNYIAKEGCSTILTPIINDDKSLNSQETKATLQSSSESSSLGLITPHQYDNTKNCNVISGQISASGSIRIQPKCSAPTRAQVMQSLDKYNIPQVEQQQPFYSDIKDVTRNVEIGYSVLKIGTKTTAHMSEFQTHNDALNTLRSEWLKTDNKSKRKTNLNQLILSHCQPKECIITPLKVPPSRDAVAKWIEARIGHVAESLASSTQQERETDEKLKLRVPLSPGNMNEDMELSLTLSPCSPTPQTPLSEASPSSPVLIDEQTQAKKSKMRQKMQQQQSSKRQHHQHNTQSTKSDNNNSCQITGITVNDTFGFAHSIEDMKEARAVIEHQNLTMMVMELHIRTRGDLKPDPAYDAIQAIFYAIQNDVRDGSLRPAKCKGIIAINSLQLGPQSSNKTPILNGLGIDCDITYTESEKNLLDELLKLLNYWDPDILAGYEIEMLSWGYLIDRSHVIGLNIKPLLGRSKLHPTLNFKDEDPSYELKIIGRIVLDVWRLMRHEISLQSYTFESMVYHVLHKRVPYYSFKDLTFWWDHRSNLYRHRTAIYYMNRVVAILELFDKLDFIGRTSELARLFGIQFYEVLSRGSQFRVESMMLRLAKPLNFIPVSPSVQQRAHMKAPEYIPLILEPESKLYNDPVIVLDFQSLYPSIIIAYNYCFTTCLGRIEHLGKNTPFEFGATQLKVPRKILEKLVKRDLLNYTPCGVAFVKKKVRDGIMPRMLREILDTRLMVKNSMKENKGDGLLQKVLHNRQLGLKLIANVTYGYTAANFSGRMPSVEVGDSVVSKGRETLQRAIDMVENTPEWGAKVVYGDTDSLFVMVPGKSREQAFEVGKKISEAVTLSNPDPIKLKLEKVYQPCILQTKKRYVGYMYESADQKEPVFEAKGIETVRRDGCPAVSKILEKCLRILFETKDVSLVKKYATRQFSKILTGRASIQDLTFAKEYRGAAGYKPGACVPALELTRKWTSTDRRNEPRSGQRVPYIIVSGSPGLPLIKLVRSPRDLLSDPSLRPNALYYITRVIIPPINRCFNLIGADLLQWFNEMPRKITQYLPSSVSPERKSTISQYFITTSCACCGEQTQHGICQECCKMPAKTAVILMEKMRMWETNYHNCILICQTCTSTQTEIKCTSLDCPVLYRRVQTGCDSEQTSYVRQLINSSELIF